jgi:hypothetical protein
MEGLEMKKAMAILIAMDPNKAADVLTGVPPPTDCLVLTLLQKKPAASRCYWAH